MVGEMPSPGLEGVLAWGSEVTGSSPQSCGLGQVTPHVRASLSSPEKRGGRT